MAAKIHPIVAREGWPLLCGMIALGGGLVWLGHVVAGITCWLLAAVLALLFRDPLREVPSSPLAIVSPADGRVVGTEKVREGWLNRESLKISTTIAYTDVYTLRAPIEGKIQQIWSSGTLRRRARVFWVQTDEGDDVLLSIHVNNFLSHLSCALNAGQRVGQGQRIGMVFGGGEVGVYLPLGSRVEVEIGTQVRGGSNILGLLVHPQAVSAAAPEQAE